MSDADFLFETEDLFFDCEPADLEPEDFVLDLSPPLPTTFAPASIAPITAPLAAPLSTSVKVLAAASTIPFTGLLAFFFAGAAFLAGAAFFAEGDFAVVLEAALVVLLAPAFEAEPDDFAVEAFEPEPDDFAAEVFAPVDFAAEVLAAEPDDFDAEVFAVEPDDFAAVVFAPDFAELLEAAFDDAPVEDDFAAAVFEPDDLLAGAAFVGAAFLVVGVFVFVFLVGIRFSPNRVNFSKS